MPTIYLPDNYVLVDNKIYLQVDSDLKFVGVMHDAIDSAYVVDGNLVVELDSNVDLISDAINPIVSVAELDASGNPITWTASIKSIRGTNKYSGDNIVNIIASSTTPTYTIVPKNEWKSGDLLGQHTDIVFTGKVNNTIPDIGLDSFQALSVENSLSITLRYEPLNFYITDINFQNGLGLINSGISQITSNNATTFTLPSDLQGLRIVDGGSKMILLTGSGKLYSYDLTIDYDVSSAVNSPTTYTIYNELGSSFTGFDFNYNGTKMYVLADDITILEFVLTTNFDISTANFINNTFISNALSDKGILANSGNNLYTFARTGALTAKTFTTPNEVWTLSQTTTTKTFDVYTIRKTYIGYPTYTDKLNGASWKRVGYDGNASDYIMWFDHYGYYNAFEFSPDGTKLYTVSDLAIDDGQINRYTLSTPWNISTAGLDESILHSFGVSTTDKVEKNYKDNGISDIKFSSDGTKMFLLDRLSVAIYQFNLPTPWSIRSMNKAIIRPIDGNIDASGYDLKYSLSQIPNPTPVDPYVAENEINTFRFTDNGLGIYVSNDQAYYKYTLATPYDLSTIFYVGSYSTSALTALGVTYGSFALDSAEDNLFVFTNGLVTQYGLDSNPASSYYKYSNKIALLDYSSDIWIDKDSANGMDMTILQQYSPYAHAVIDHFDSVQDIEKFFYHDSLPTYLNLEDLGFSTIAKSDITNKIFLTKDKMVYEYDLLDSTVAAQRYEITGSITSITGFDWNYDGSIFYICGNSRVESYKTKNTFRTVLT